MMKIKVPCVLDHNGECLVCDCGIMDCAYDRWINNNYQYETEEELNEMFKSYEKPTKI